MAFHPTARRAIDHLAHRRPAERDVQRGAQPFRRPRPKERFEHAQARANPNHRERAVPSACRRHQREQRGVAACDEEEDRRVIEAAHPAARGRSPLNAVV
jgi:hypothetical protein